MKFIQPKLIALFFSLISGFWPIEGLSVYPSLTVVASITPFHSLVAAVMKGVGTPKLLIKTGASPHHYSLKPSEIQSLNTASLIFWGGPALETFLIKPLHNIERKQKVLIVQLDKTPDLLLLPLRRNIAWEPHDHSHDHHEHCSEHILSNNDMHFWLDPNNAITLTDSIVYHLSKIDPQHKDIYRKNGEILKIQLKQLDIKIANELKEVKSVPYVVFHDAYQYFDHHYKLNGVGAITLHPEVPPSAQRLSAIRDIIKNTKAHCVFSEPQFSPKLVQSITQDLQIKTGELDPIGERSINDADGYFNLLENLSNSIRSCLKSK